MGRADLGKGRRRHPESQELVLEDLGNASGASLSGGTVLVRGRGRSSGSRPASSDADGDPDEPIPGWVPTFAATVEEPPSARVRRHLMSRSADLHRLVSRYNPDRGYQPLYEVTHDPDCELATSIANRGGWASGSKRRSIRN